MTRPLLSIVVPLYRSADSIERLIRELSALPVEGGCELVLVNDGSPDNTAELAEKFMQTSARPITLVKLSRNFGEYNAVMAGLHQATGDYIVTMDDDLQNPPSEVLKLLAHAQAGKYDVVYSFYAEKQHDRGDGNHHQLFLAVRLRRRPGRSIVRRLLGRRCTHASSLAANP